jgi:hypothetical protein
MAIRSPQDGAFFDFRQVAAKRIMARVSQSAARAVKLTVKSLVIQYKNGWVTWVATRFFSCQIQVLAERAQRPRDPNWFAKLIAEMATGEAADTRPGG